MIGTAIGAGLLGILTWSLLEYAFHRWAAHGRGVWRSTPFGEEHTRHHVEGNYFAPTLRKVIAAVVIMAIVAPIAVAITTPVAGCSFASMLVLTYVAYEVLHRRLHTHAGGGAYGRWARHHHFYHHFVDARTNHGVTSPLWDIVFGTHRKSDTIHVPPRLCMSWLVDPRTGSVIEAYADTFVIGKSST
jgi:sterol desaturase/sphingolipid hydroxylase (fatty acid hydroxylase superfamily)